MRGQVLQDCIVRLLGESFDSDVVDAVSGGGAFVNLCRVINDQCSGKESSMRGVIKAVASSASDSTLDWLVVAAEDPAAWFIKQVRES